jgi:serine/threonine-protein kinase HipA
MRRAEVYLFAQKTGILTEDENGYTFQYDEKYLSSPGSLAVSLTLPLRTLPYQDKVLLPFFDGLIPEGWLLDIAVENWKLDSRDRMGLLLTCCRECIGAASIIDITEEYDSEE